MNWRVLLGLGQGRPDWALQENQGWEWVCTLGTPGFFLLLAPCPHRARLAPPGRPS